MVRSLPPIGSAYNRRTLPNRLDDCQVGWDDCFDLSPNCGIHAQLVDVFGACGRLVLVLGAWNSEHASC